MKIISSMKVECKNQFNSFIKRSSINKFVFSLHVAVKITKVLQTVHQFCVGWQKKIPKIKDFLVITFGEEYT